jgi:hypothetical protein
VYDDLWATLRAGRTWAGRLINRRKDGTRYLADLSTEPGVTLVLGRVPADLVAVPPIDHGRPQAIE